MRRNHSSSSRNHRGITPKPFPHCRIASCSRHTRNCIRRPDAGLETSRRADGNGGVTEESSMVQLCCVSPVASCRSRWRCVRWRSSAIASPASARSHHGARTARASCVTPSSHHVRHYRHHRHYRHIARGSRWDAAWRRCRRAALPMRNASFGSECRAGRRGMARQVASARPTSSPRRAAISAAIPPAAAACGARVS